MEKIYLVVILMMMSLAFAQATSCYNPAQVTQPIREPVATIK